MDSLEALSKAAALLMAISAIAAPQHGLAQASSAATLPDDAAQRQIVDRIRQLQAEDGPESLTLVEPLSELARLYEDRKEYAAATETVGRAQQIVRLNRGLYSIEQAPLMQQAVRIEKRKGDAAAAWELEQQLLVLANRHLDDLRTVPVLHAVGDARLELLERYSAGQAPPELVLGCYYKRPEDGVDPNCGAGSRGQAIRAIYADVLGKYSQAIGTLFRNEAYASAELRDIEMKIVRASYQQGDYQHGKDSLRRLLSYDVAKTEPWATRVEALVQMADWDLLFARYRRAGHGGYWRWRQQPECYSDCIPPPPGDTLEAALQTYEQAYSALVAAQAGDESIARIFAPRTPVVLPTFAESPLAIEQTPEATGYVDVAFEIAKDGGTHGVSVLGSSANASTETKKEAVREIKESVFRPRLVDGKVVEATPVTLRLYATEVAPVSTQ